MKILIGNTGLIGKTLCESIDFDYLYNSQNIDNFVSEIESGGDLYLSCLPATKWMVNKDPLKDIKNIDKILNIIRNKTYKKIVLFSTIDIYNSSPIESDETYHPTINEWNYGNNRYYFELKIKELLGFEKLNIFRLPALYGKYIKKNILFDLLNNNNVENINTNSAYQWYNLNNLVKDIEKYPDQYPKENIFNLFPEPVDTEEIIKLFPQYSILKQTSRVDYNYTTKFGKYIETKETSIKQIEKFIYEYSHK